MKFKKLLLMLSMVSAVGVVGIFGTVVAHADGVTSVAVSSDQLQPIISAVTDNIAVILPIAIGIFGIFFGIKLIPKLINMFKRG